jgi:diguanylate cyclase (GGDEF)-like protein
MAATDPRPLQDPFLHQGGDSAALRAPARRGGERSHTAVPLRCLDAGQLLDRVEEEVSRAGRYGAALSCLLLRLENFEQIAEAHGAGLSERALLHAGETLLGELRRFDRVGRPLLDELVVVLPGAASAQGEAVARRALRRLRAIKIEADLVRQPLCVSIGIAAWRSPWSAQQLIEEARRAAGSMPQGNGD